MSCHDQGTSVKQGCAGAPGGGSPGTLERANEAGVRESVVAVASQLHRDGCSAETILQAGGWPLPYRLPEPGHDQPGQLSAEGFPRVAKWLPAAAKAYRARWRGKGWTC